MLSKIPVISSPGRRAVTRSPRRAARASQASRIGPKPRAAITASRAAKAGRKNVEERFSRHLQIGQATPA